MSNLVSLYVASGSDLQSVRRLIQREQVTSTNVKDRWTRQEVGSALKNLLHYLNNFKKVPENGLILFASSDGVESVDPPVPCHINLYRCGSEFYREPLEVLEDSAAGEKCGLVLIDTNEASVCWFRGDTVIALWHDYSGIMGKHDAGGQSQRRFERGHEEQRKRWWRKVAEVAERSLLASGITKLVVAGPGFTKQDMLKDEVLDYRFKIIAVVDAEYVDDVAGPREALARWRAAE